MNDNGWCLANDRILFLDHPRFRKQDETKQRRLAAEEKKRLEEDKAKVLISSTLRDTPLLIRSLLDGCSESSSVTQERRSNEKDKPLTY